MVAECIVSYAPIRHRHATLGGGLHDNTKNGRWLENGDHRMRGSSAVLVLRTIENTGFMRRNSRNTA